MSQRPIRSTPLDYHSLEPQAVLVEPSIDPSQWKALVIVTTSWILLSLLSWGIWTRGGLGP